MDRYSASTPLERFILDAAPPWMATADAPNTWAQLQLERSKLDSGQPIPVYSGGCDNTIYSSPRVNHAFRAWHDGLHLALDADFSPPGEQRVLAAHLWHMGMHSKNYGLVDEDFAAMTADVLGQVMYYSRHKKYVVDQAAFVSSCMRRGILRSIKEVW